MKGSLGLPSKLQPVNSKYGLTCPFDDVRCKLICFAITGDEKARLT